MTGLMTALPAWNGWIRHFLLTIHLNFRNSQAIVYGYLVPIVFLLAFGSVFRADSPPLLAQMGQIVTITILGGACFGLPTALVAEREQGIWRRYRLLPVPIPWLVFSAMLARVLIVASSILVQIALARAIFGTPFPSHPGAAMLAFLFVTAAFLGIGLLIAALADSVPAVQALGQCIFLPMIMIGGVGVPLAVLPAWAQRLAGFMPGRYAVEVLQPCFNGPHGIHGAEFRLGALAVIGMAAAVSGTKLFRGEAPGTEGRWRHRLGARRKELAAQLVPQPYWKVGFGRIDPKFIAGMNAINKDQMKMLRDALGPGAESQSDDPIGQAMMKNAGGGISSENLKRIQAIQSDYGELMSEVYASTNGTWMPEDHEKLAYLQNEQQDDMAKALSPNDLFEYQLRNSPAAMMLRNNLQAFNPTEDEFRAILKAQQDFDQRFGSASVPLSADQQRERQAHQAELLSNIQDVLGPDRFAEYKQDTDPNYMTTNRLVERLNQIGRASCRERE